MTNDAPLLNTTRLSLHYMTEADAPFMLALLNSPGWLQYIGDRNVHTVSEAEAYLLNRIIKGYKDNGFGFYRVMERETDEDLGICGLVRRPGLDYVDIGFAFLDRAQGKGFAFEAASAVMDYAFGMLHLSEVAAITLPENARSIRLLEKLGLVRHKIVRLPDDDDELLLYLKRNEDHQL